VVSKNESEHDKLVFYTASMLASSSVRYKQFCRFQGPGSPGICLWTNSLLVLCTDHWSVVSAHQVSLWSSDLHLGL